MFCLLGLIMIVIIFAHLMGHCIDFYFKDVLTKIKYKWPIGLFAIFGILQLVSFIPQYFYAPMTTVTILYSITFIFMAIFIIATLFKMTTDQRQAIFKFKKECWIDYVIIIGFILFNFVICFSTNSLNDTNADQSFYINLVKNNVDVSQINMIAPLSGKIEPLQELYIYQGFYLLMTYLSKVFNLEALLVMGWLVPTLLWISVATTFLNIYHYFKLPSHDWKKITTFLILWVLYDHFEYLIRYNVYGNNLRPLVFVYLMMLYNDYFHRMKKGSLLVCGLLWLGGIALQSTTLFLGIMLMVSYGLYEIFFFRKNAIVQLVMSAIPLMIYLAFFMKSRGSWIPAIAILCFLVILPFVKNIVYSKWMKGLIVIGVVGMIVLSIKMTPVLNPSASVSPTDLLNFIKEQYLFSLPLDSSSILVCMRWMILILNGYALFNWSSLSSMLKRCLMIQLILILVFFNPFVCGFISTALTGIVYTRIYEVVMSLFLIGSLLAYSYENSKIQLVNKILLILAVSFLGLKTKEYLTNDFNRISSDTTFNHLYRMEQDMIDVSLTLRDEIEHSAGERPLVLTVHLQLNYLANNYEMLYTVSHNRKLYDEIARTAHPDIYLMYEVLQRSYEIDEMKLNQFMSAVRECQVAYVMTKQDLAPVVLETFNAEWNIIYENPSYRLYKIIY